MEIFITGESLVKVSGAKKFFLIYLPQDFSKKILLKMKIFEIFSDFSGFDCNIVFPYGEHEPERYEPFRTESDRILVDKSVWKTRVQNRAGTPNFKVA
jgi:hypothetical protein